MSKEPWEVLPSVWKTEAAFMSWVRSGIRRSLWNKSPIKLEFIKRNRVKIPNPNPRGKVKEVWGGVCSLTGKVCALSELEVDHKTGNHSLRKIEDIQSFIEGIILVTLDDLQFVSKEAHRTKSYAEKEGITYEEAYAVKKAISLIKEKKDRQFLTDNGLVPASNQTKRREQIVEYLRGVQC